MVGRQDGEGPVRRVCGWFWKLRREAQPQHADLHRWFQDPPECREGGSSTTTSASGDPVLWDPINRREGNQNYREKTLQYELLEMPGVQPFQEVGGQQFYAAERSREAKRPQKGPLGFVGTEAFSGGGGGQKPV